MKLDRSDYVLLFVVIAAFASVFVGSEAVDVLVKPKAEQATYVYDKDDTVPPPAILSALDKMNRSGIMATVFEESTRDGDGEVPDQYKLPYSAVKEADLPSLVVTGGGKVLRVVGSPSTEEQALEAVR